MKTQQRPACIKAIIGLGNPGARFSLHRHNIGFIVLDALAQDWHLSWSSTPLMAHASIQSSHFDQEHQERFGSTVHLIKPQTFMNTSGQALPFLMKKGIKPSEIVVVHDELEKKFGQVTMRCGGSARGHNGLRSIMSVIGADFWRVRVGIGRPEHKDEVPTYVLSNFTSHEQQELDLITRKVIDLIF